MDIERIIWRWVIVWCIFSTWYVKLYFLGGREVIFVALHEKRGLVLGVGMLCLVLLVDVTSNQLTVVKPMDGFSIATTANV